MAKQQTKYLADDDTAFDTEAEADAHNVALKAKGDIEQYITYAGLEKAQAGLLRKHVSGYLTWIAAGKPAKPTPEAGGAST